MLERARPRRILLEPPPQEAGGSAAQARYAPESLLLPGVGPDARDAQVRDVLAALPDGTGPSRRAGVCNASGAVYREVKLHGPVQLLYFWAGLNALGFRQRAVNPASLSRYDVLFEHGAPRRPLA